MEANTVYRGHPQDPRSQDLEEEGFPVEAHCLRPWDHQGGCRVRSNPNFSAEGLRNCSSNSPLTWRVYSLAPYEKRIIELLRNSKDKRARRLAKKRVRLPP